MTSIRVLVIDDEKETVADVLEAIRKQGYGLHFVEDFAEAEGAIRQCDPDVIVLDLLGPGGTGEPGLGTREFVWTSHFCPLVVYTAAPELMSDLDHPFVETVKKGMGSPAKVMSAIEEFRPHMEAVRSARQSMRTAFAFALRDVAPDAFRIYGNADDQKRTDLILRAGRRRAAALVDENLDDATSMQSWEQYICPPVTAQVRLGDILRSRDMNAGNPASFRVVLTPSCDLAVSEVRAPKVAQVLTARCHHIAKALKAVNIEDLGSGGKKDKLKTELLSQGYKNGILPLPGLPGRIPHMAVDLRDLDLIPFGEIGGTGTRFERIASVDSPFRELIAWAYMQVGCRPGVPDRDLDAWCDEISTCLTGEG